MRIFMLDLYCFDCITIQFFKSRFLVELLLPGFGHLKFNIVLLQYRTFKTDLFQILLYISCYCKLKSLQKTVNPAFNHLVRI